MELKPLRTVELKIADFDATKTFNCGQCFRWRQLENRHIGIIGHSALSIELDDIRQTKFNVTIYGEDLSDEALYTYFDGARDYRNILERLSKKDEHLSAAIHEGEGIRILNQDPFETLISFIISSNNNIPKIKMSIEALAEKFGKFIGTLEGLDLYAFPSVEDLHHADLEALNVKAIGYRAKSVKNTCDAIVFNQIDLSIPFKLAYKEAQTWLMQFYGVGEKVTDCILLFSYGKDDAFPIDTWVKKILGDLYGVQSGYSDFIKRYFIDFPGIAQQYLFYYMRNRKV